MIVHKTASLLARNSYIIAKNVNEKGFPEEAFLNGN